MKQKALFIIFALSLSICAFSQKDAKGWHLLDPVKDTVYGINLNSAYNLLKNKKSTPVIVAVIDSGIDTTHEDLKNILWTNPGEIAGNGIDDDKNGYIDDVHGWNFLGNRDGENIDNENSEKTRIYYKYKDKFDGQDINPDALSENDKWIYDEWLEVASQMEVSQEEQMEVMMLELTSKALKKHDAIIKLALNDENYTINDLEKFVPQTQEAKQAKMGFITAIKMIGLEGDETAKSILEDLDEYTDGKKKSIEAKTSAPPDYRALVIKDNYDDFNDRYYGNNDVMGRIPNMEHMFRELLQRKEIMELEWMALQKM